MPEITVDDWENVDLDKIATLTLHALQNSSFHDPERTLEDVQAWLKWNHERFPPSAVFQAYRDGTLVGWLTVTTDVKPSISETWRWLPSIAPEAREQEDEIARGLIRKCIEYVRDYGQTRLEACFDKVSEITMPTYKRYRVWFEAEGVYKVDENAYMRRDLNPSEFGEKDLALPSNYGFKPLVEVNADKLYDCYRRAFQESDVSYYHDLTEDERRAEFEFYFMRKEGLHRKASVVVVMDDENVGFSLIHSRPAEAHLADLGIVPAHRGRGLGRRMLSYSLHEAAQEYDTITLAVDVKNTMAYNLYRDLGFNVEYRLITHAWSSD